ncbi:MAG: type VI secretion system baseplate subunit TssK [bacterium]|nr:type VI secretion system baseplate subunit TssK [bacterium]
MNGQVHWEEGLFLQPHHLQSMQRSILESSAAERRLTWSYPYGLVEAKLSRDALENKLIQFDRLRVIMPSGLEVNVPDNTDLPVLSIKETFEASSGFFPVYLGVPLWQAKRGNTIERGGAEDWRVKRLYRVAEVERPDENTGENPQPILVRRLNARLLLDSDDPSDMEVLPLLRIGRGAGEEAEVPRQDPNFIPACLVLRGSAILRDLVRDLSQQVEATRQELVVQLTRGGFSIERIRGIQLEQLLRLRTLNRFSGRLPHLVQAPAVTPFEMYLELRELLGELAALFPDRDQFEVAKYDHDNPAIAFNELSIKIRSLLRGAVAPSFIRVEFVPMEQVLVAALEDEHLTRPNEYFLGIRTKEDPSTVARLVEDPDKFKLMAKSLVTRAIWGVRLEEERHPPLTLPAEVGLHYFRLRRDESARMWERVQEEKAMSARWPGMESSDFKVALYMTVPEKEK